MSEPTRRGGDQTSTTAKAANAERLRKALELRLAGASYEAIATALSYSGRATAYKAVQRALANRTREPANELRKLELERLDEMTLHLTKKMRAGNVDVIDKLLRVMGHRAKLTPGLTAPVVVAHELDGIRDMFTGFRMDITEQLADAEPGDEPTPADAD